MTRLNIGDFIRVLIRLEVTDRYEMEKDAQLLGISASAPEQIWPKHDLQMLYLQTCDVC